jgi:hypothetical protein
MSRQTSSAQGCSRCSIIVAPVESRSTARDRREKASLRFDAPDVVARYSVSREFGPRRRARVGNESALSVGGSRGGEEAGAWWDDLARHIRARGHRRQGLCRRQTRLGLHDEAGRTDRGKRAPAFSPRRRPACQPRVRRRRKRTPACSVTQGGRRSRASCRPLVLPGAREYFRSFALILCAPAFTRGRRQRRPFCKCKRTARRADNGARHKCEAPFTEGSTPWPPAGRYSPAGPQTFSAKMTIAPCGSTTTVSRMP